MGIGAESKGRRAFRLVPLRPHQSRGDAGLERSSTQRCPQPDLNGLPMCWRTVTSRRGSTITYALVLLEGEAEHSLLKVRLLLQCKTHTGTDEPERASQETGLRPALRHASGSRRLRDPVIVGLRLGGTTLERSLAGMMMQSSFLGWELNKQKQHARRRRQRWLRCLPLPNRIRSPLRQLAQARKRPVYVGKGEAWERPGLGATDSSPDSITATLTVNGRTRRR